MGSRSNLTELTGDWVGTNRLWLSPDDPVRESGTAATVTLAARGAFLSIRYGWSERSKPQDGALMIRIAAERHDPDVVWVNSWHMKNQFMLCRREDDSDGRVAARGRYAAPPGPDWGWRIVLEARTTEAMRILMYNVAPDGNEMLAVEAKYSRLAGPLM